MEGLKRDSKPDMNIVSERKPPGTKEFGIRVKVPDESLEPDLLESVHSTFDYSSFSSSSDEEDEDDKTEMFAVSENDENEDMDKRNKAIDEYHKCKEDNWTEDYWAEVDESDDSVVSELDVPDQNLPESFARSDVQGEIEKFRELCVKYVKYEDGQRMNAIAVRLYKEGLHDRAIHEFKWAAKHCHSIPAYYNLGVCFMEKQDFMKALRYYKEAADKNHASASCNIAYIILNYRTKLEKRYSEADGIMFLKRAAELGLKQAQTEYGIILMEKKENAEMAEMAALFFELAARQKHPLAMYHLGCCFEKGLGVEVNSAKAAHQYARASRRQHPIAQHNLGVFFEFGFGGLIENKEEAMKWYKEAVKNGHHKSMDDVKRLKRMDASKDEVTVVAEQPSFEDTPSLTKGDRVPNLMALANQFDIDDVSMSTLDME